MDPEVESPKFFCLKAVAAKNGMTKIFFVGSAGFRVSSPLYLSLTTSFENLGLDTGITGFSFAICFYEMFSTGKVRKSGMLQRRRDLICNKYLCSLQFILLWTRFCITNDILYDCFLTLIEQSWLTVWERLGGRVLKMFYCLFCGGWLVRDVVVVQVYIRCKC